MSIRPYRLARLVRAAVVLAALAVVFAPPVAAAPTCDLDDLDGTFAFVIHGVNPAGEPFGAIGTLTADGAGNIDGFRVAVDNGEYGTADFTCTYAMSANCLFRGPCVDDGEAIPEVQIDGALADGGREIMLVVTGIPNVLGGAVVTGTARKQ